MGDGVSWSLSALALSLSGSRPLVLGLMKVFWVALPAGIIAAGLTALVWFQPNVLGLSVLIGVLTFILVLWMLHTSFYRRVGASALAAAFTCAGTPTIKAVVALDVKNIANVVGSIDIDGGSGAAGAILVVMALACFILDEFEKRRLQQIIDRSGRPTDAEAEELVRLLQNRMRRRKGPK